MKGGVILAVWLIGTAGALTATALPKLLPREAPAVIKESGLAQEFHLPLNLGNQVLGKEEKPIWINAWRYGCPCSADREKEVRQLLKEFGGEFEVLHLISPGLSPEAEVLKEWHSKGIPGEVLIDPEGDSALKLGLWAAPTALILDSGGSVVFRGSYNVARSCFDDKTSFGRMALTVAAQGGRPEVKEVPSYGCSIIP